VRPNAAARSLLRAQPLRLLFGAAAFATLLGGSLWAQSTITTLGPGARVQVTAIFDAAQRQLIVFGGQNPGITNFNDTWEDRVDDEVYWTRLSPSGTAPAARAGHTAVYDAANSIMVVFGGGSGINGASSGACLNDVWTLENTNGVNGTPAWIRLAPSGTQPPARANHSAVYDPATNSMVIFGGTDCNSNYLHDAWVLSNANGLGGTPSWRELFPSGSLPPAREFASAFYDSSSGRMGIFGGDAGSSVYMNDVWLLNNATGVSGSPSWAQQSPTGTLPTPRSGQVAGFDAANNRFIVFGGANQSGTILGETWILADASASSGVPAWSLLAVSVSNAQGTARANQGGDYDASQDKLWTWGGRLKGVAADDHIFVLSDANGLQ